MTRAELSQSAVWDFVTAPPVNGPYLRLTQSRLTPPILDAGNTKKANTRKGGDLSGSPPFRHLIRLPTCDQIRRSTVVAAASGVLALAALAYLAFLLVGGMF